MLVNGKHRSVLLFLDILLLNRALYKPFLRNSGLRFVSKRNNSVKLTIIVMELVNCKW